VRKDEIKKRKVITLYKEKWHVGVRNTDMPVEQLENILSAKATKKQQKHAVIKIQTSFRRHQAQKRYREFVSKRDNAARYIQRVYKRYRMISMVPKAWRKFKNDRITRIQKFIRGYLAYKSVFSERFNTKLKTNFDYFDKIKYQLQENAQIKIRYYWLRKKRLDQERKEQEAKKKKNGKNNKRGSLVKKNTLINRNPPSPIKKQPSKLEIQPNKNLNSTLPSHPESPLFKIQSAGIGELLNLTPIQTEQIEEEDT
jgi:hypothetical protein